MIKRADGSYSQRGLWDNIRANKGSGKKPTKEMLEQEKKLNKFQDGGYLKNSSKQKVNPFIQAPLTSSNNPEGFFWDWINSPEYSQRLSNTGYVNPQETVSMRNKNLENFDYYQFPKNAVNVQSQARPGTSVGARGFIRPQMLLHPGDIEQAGINTLYPHELSHIIGAAPGAGTLIPQDGQRFKVGYTPQEEKILQKSIINPSKKLHDRKPFEIKADIDSNRYNLFQKGIYDIRKGTPFTIDDLNRAKKTLKDDESFKRLLEQVGDENYINLMNTIAMGNVDDTQMQAAYGGYINPMQEQYFLGGLFGSKEGAGFLGQGFNAGKGSSVTGMTAGMLSSLIPGQNKQGNTSIGGSAAKGALGGIAAGASFGPIGMGIGALVGGLGGLFQGKKQQKAELAEQKELEKLERDTNTRNALAQLNFSNSSNLPMAYGGLMNSTELPIGSFTHFTNGGTHESNPLGGIPQGYNSKGQLRTTEQNEGKFKFPEGDYIFSNRLKFE